MTSPPNRSEARNRPTRERGEVRIGISGWSYAGWRGVFYPRGLPQSHELRYAAERFRSIEINGTFYRMQRPEHFASWAEQTPADFVFSVKVPRFITHAKKLRDAHAPFANFLASGLLRLGPKLGPLLWQFPPQMRWEPERFGAWFRLLPRDTEAAVAFAKRYRDHRVEGRAWMQTEAPHPLRHAIEVRHNSFCVPDFVEMLRAHDLALVVADTVSWPRKMDLTTDFVYCRLHGSKELYVSGYDDVDLDAWARRIRAWAIGREPRDAERIAGPALCRRRRDVFVYFDNDAKVRAPVDALSLIGRLTPRAAPPSTPSSRRRRS